jgi:hypothetical protein
MSVPNVSTQADLLQEILGTHAAMKSILKDAGKISRIGNASLENLSETQGRLYCLRISYDIQVEKYHNNGGNLEELAVLLFGSKVK